MPHRAEQTDAFDVIDDRGRRYRMLEFTEFVDGYVLNGERRGEHSYRSYKLGSGQHCTIDTDGTFIVIRTGLRLRRLA